MSLEVYQLKFLQVYYNNILFKGSDNPDDALENISDIKSIKEACTTT